MLSTLDSLADEILLEIICDLDFPSLAKLARTSKRFTGIAEENLFRRDFLGSEQLVGPSCEPVLAWLGKLSRFRGSTRDIRTDINGSRALIWAAENNDMALLEKCLARGGHSCLERPGLLKIPFIRHVETRPREQYQVCFGTPLHAAAARGNNEILLAFLNRGANVDTFVKTYEPADLEDDQTQFTPLYAALVNSHSSTACILLDWQASTEVVTYPEDQEYYDASALHIAAFNRLETVVKKLLIDRGEDVDRDLESFTPLHMAAHVCDSASMLRFLLEAGADVNELNHYGSNALHFVIENKRQSPSIMTSVKILLDAGVDINVSNFGDLTPVGSAAAMSNPEVLSCLLGHPGLSLNQDSPFGVITDLKIGCLSDIKRCAEMIVQAGFPARLNHITPFIFGQIEIAEVLLPYLSEVTGEDKVMLYFGAMDESLHEDSMAFVFKHFPLVPSSHPPEDMYDLLCRMLRGRAINNENVNHLLLAMPEIAERTTEIPRNNRNIITSLAYNKFYEHSQHAHILRFILQQWGDINQPYFDCPFNTTWYREYLQAFSRQKRSDLLPILDLFVEYGLDLTILVTVNPQHWRTTFADDPNTINALISCVEKQAMEPKDKEEILAKLNQVISGVPIR